MQTDLSELTGVLWRGLLTVRTLDLLNDDVCARLTRYIDQVLAHE